MMEESLFAGLSWCALIAGLFILFQSLLADRARGRRRCPKCWYDLSRTNGRRCAECGHEAKRERALFRTRRRWGWFIVGVIVLIASHPVARVPIARAHGAAAFAPDWLLVAVLPWYDSDSPAATPNDPNATGATWPFAELDRRIRSEKLGSLGAQMLAARAFHGDSKRPPHLQAWSPYLSTLNNLKNHAALRSDEFSSRLMTASIHVGADVRNEWPSDQPIHCKFWLQADRTLDVHARFDPITSGLESREVWQIRTGDSYYPREFSPQCDRPIGTPPKGTTELRYTVTLSHILSQGDQPLELGEQISRFEMTVPVTMTEDATFPLVIEPDDRFARALHETGIAWIQYGNVVVHIPAIAGSALRFDDLDDDGDKDPVTIGARALVLDGTEVIAESTTYCDYYSHLHNDELVFELEDDMAARIDSMLAAGASLRIRVTLEPDQALRNHKSVQTVRGEFELPLHALSQPVNGTAVMEIERRVFAALAEHATVMPFDSQMFLVQYDVPAHDPIPSDGVMFFEDCMADVLIDGELQDYLYLSRLIISPNRVSGTFWHAPVWQNGTPKARLATPGIVRFRAESESVLERRHEYAVTIDPSEPFDPWFLLHGLDLQFEPVQPAWPWQVEVIVAAREDAETSE